jgi:hypothetical protein
MIRFGTLALVGLVSFAAVAPAQLRDTVYYRDRTAKPEKTAEFAGTVTEETVNGIKVKPLVGPDRSFPVGDIVDVVYAPPRALEIPFQPILAGETALRTGTADKAKMAQILKDYTTFLNSSLKDTKAPSLRRQIQYKLAILKAATAEKREEQLDAIKQFDQVRKEVAGSWQLIPAVRQEVTLLADLDRLDEATRVLEEASKTQGLAKDLKQELELSLIDLMIRTGKSAEVEGKIAAALQSLPPTDPMATKLKVFQLGAQAGKGDPEKSITQLKTIIDQAQDSSLKALAYNTLGDCYSAKGQKSEAKWAYLWVDVVYNQDKAEHAKAVERLSRVFKDLNDDARADKYKEKLKSLR